MAFDGPDVEQILFGLEEWRRGETRLRGGRLHKLVGLGEEVSREAYGARRRVPRRPYRGPEGRRGTLAVTVGDGEKTFQRLLLVFKALGGNMIYVGPVGYGQAVEAG